MFRSKQVITIKNVYEDEVIDFDVFHYLLATLPLNFVIPFYETNWTIMFISLKLVRILKYICSRADKNVTKVPIFLLLRAFPDDLLPT